MSENTCYCTLQTITPQESLCIPCCTRCCLSTGKNAEPNSCASLRHCGRVELRLRKFGPPRMILSSSGCAVMVEKFQHTSVTQKCFSYFSHSSPDILTSANGSERREGKPLRSVCAPLLARGRLLRKLHLLEEIAITSF